MLRSAAALCDVSERLSVHTGSMGHPVFTDNGTTGNNEETSHWTHYSVGTNVYNRTAMETKMKDHVGSVSVVVDCSPSASSPK